MLRKLILTSLVALCPLFTLAAEPVVIDVRTPDEHNENRVKGSANIDFRSADFRSKIEKLDREKPYDLYCRTGNRSGQALKIMQEMGFKRVQNLGSVEDAAKVLKLSCEGKAPKC